MSETDKIKQLTRLILQLHGPLVAEARLVLEQTDLTVSRSRLLGALVQRPEGQTIPELAFRMGQARQGVFRLCKIMLRDGLVEMSDNPSHQKSKLVRITDKGRRIFETANLRQDVSALRLRANLNDDEIAVAVQVLSKLAETLQA